MEKENKTGQEKKIQVKVMIKKIKNKIWLFLKKIYTKLPEKMKVHIRKLKPKEKIRGMDTVILDFTCNQHYLRNL